jgi:RNA polymerase sigma-70 factor (ECF subfamily)
MADSAPKSSKNAQFESEALPHLEDVARFALSLARDQSDADDLVQETYLRAYRAWNSYELGTDCRRWLFTICRNVFLRGRERSQRMVMVEDPELESLASAALSVAARQSGFGDVFTDVDLRPAIMRALSELPEQFRQAVELVDLEDLTYDAAADICGVPIGTIRSRLFRARRLLQESLLSHARDAGFAAAGEGCAQEELR